jgi:hypothetical protein
LLSHRQWGSIHALVAELFVVNVDGGLCRQNLVHSSFESEIDVVGRYDVELEPLSARQLWKSRKSGNKRQAVDAQYVASKNGGIDSRQLLLFEPAQ